MVWGFDKNDNDDTKSETRRTTLVLLLLLLLLPLLLLLLLPEQQQVTLRPRDYPERVTKGCTPEGSFLHAGLSVFCGNYSSCHDR